jgi:hypothetical protein
MKKIFALLFTAAIILPAMAQQPKKSKKAERRQRIDALIKQEEEGVIAYRKHTAYGVKLTSDGYGAFLEIGRARSIRKGILYQLEITERKHPKEDKAIDVTTGVLVTYGKQNFVYPIRLGAQFQYLLGNKSNKNGVSVSANAGGGLSIALLRPYLLEVEDGTGRLRYVGYDSPDSVLFLNGPYNRNPGLGTGWKNMKVSPGAYAKAALRFDYGRYNEVVTALEVGVMAEFYGKKIPQMVYEKQRNLFLSAYISIMFGRRK